MTVAHDEDKSAKLKATQSTKKRVPQYIIKVIASQAIYDINLHVQTAVKMWCLCASSYNIGMHDHDCWDYQIAPNLSRLSSEYS